MSRLMHLTALLLSMLVAGQGVLPLGAEWICNATGTPMRGCPCTSAHTGSGSAHAHEAGLSKAACCEQVVPAAEATGQVAAASKVERQSLEKALPPASLDAPFAVPALARLHPVGRRHDVPEPSGPPGYLRLRHLLI